MWTLQRYRFYCLLYRLIWAHPRWNRLLKVIRGGTPAGDLRTCDLMLDGYPRSGNTFAKHMFLLS